MCLGTQILISRLGSRILVLGKSSVWIKKLARLVLFLITVFVIGLFSAWWFLPMDLYVPVDTEFGHEI